MPGFVVDVCADFEEFTDRWGETDDLTASLLWQLLGRLTEDELLVELPDWLADRKVGYTDGGTPTLFVGRVVEETEKAIRLADATDARPLMRLAHRMDVLENGLAREGLEESRRAWMEDRLRVKRTEFENREEMGGLREEWLPKSQIVSAVRRPT